MPGFPDSISEACEGPPTTSCFQTRASPNAASTCTPVSTGRDGAQKAATEPQDSKPTKTENGHHVENEVLTVNQLFLNDGFFDCCCRHMHVTDHREGCWLACKGMQACSRRWGYMSWGTEGGSVRCVCGGG
jgi:hypothetical protein